MVQTQISKTPLTVLLWMKQLTLMKINLLLHEYLTYNKQEVIAKHTKADLKDYQEEAKMNT